jgi:hypothetical protein
VTPRLQAQTALQTTLRPLAEQRQALIAQRDQLIEAIAGLSDDISTRMVLEDQKSIRTGPYLLTIIENSGRNTLDKRRLIELGVDPDVILEATTRSAPSTSLQVRVAAEE